MSQPNKAENKAEKQTTSRFVDCDNCAMQAVCLPLGTENKTIDLTDNYLTKRIEVDSKQDALNQSTGAKLFEQGQPLTAIYAVCSGAFKLSQQNDEGIEKVVGFRFPGEVMGEDALFLEKYNYSAIALGDNSVCEVFVAPLSACGNLVPELQQNLIKLLTKQSFEQQRNTQALIGKKSADCLLAAFLLNICQRYAKHSGTTTGLELTMSRYDIANFLGIRRETLSRLLSKLQQEQIISIKGTRFSILSLDSLTKLAKY